MAIEVRMAKLSPTMETGTINRWLKKEGDPVASGDTLAEVETDKASMPLETFEDGKLLKILVPEGKAAKIDELVAIIGAEGEDISALLAGGGPTGAPQKVAVADAARPGAQGTNVPAEAAPATPGHGAQGAAVAPAGGGENGGRIKASPLAKKIARERGVDLGSIQPSGPGGRIVVRDLEGAAPGAQAPRAPAAAAAPAPIAAPAAPAAMAAPVPVTTDGEDIPLTNMRQTIARRLLQSKQTIPHFYLHSEVSMDRMAAYRDELNAAQGEGGVKISFNDLVIKVCAVALKKHPEVNASFNQTSIRRYRDVNIAVAVATDDGLYTPVLRNVDKLGLAAISKGVKELAGKARDKKLRVEELTGSGFTISNLGMFGIDHFFAIINPPESAILAIGAIKNQPVVNAAGQIVAGKVMGVSLSCDHRVIDGAVGARFMATVKDLLENPAKLLL